MSGARSRAVAGLLRLSGRALGTSAHVERDRVDLRDDPTSPRAGKGRIPATRGTAAVGRTEKSARVRFSRAPPAATSTAACRSEIATPGELSRQLLPGRMNDGSTDLFTLEMLIGESPTSRSPPIFRSLPRK